MAVETKDTTQVSISIDELSRIVKEEISVLKDDIKTDILKNHNPFADTNVIVKSNDPNAVDKFDGRAFGRFVQGVAIATKNHESLKIVGERLKDSYRGEVEERVSKALSITEMSAGGVLVPQEFVNELIPYLYAASVVRKSGAQVWQMPQGSLRIPKETGAPTATWAGELANTTDTSITYGDIELFARKLTCPIVVSNDLLNESVLNVEQSIRNNMVGAMAVAEDSAFLFGSGASNQPKGLYYWIASGNVMHSAGTSLANCTSDFNLLLEKVEGNNINIANGAWYMSTKSKNFLSSILNSLGLYVWRDEILNRGTLAGYPLYATNNIKNTYGAQDALPATSSYSKIFFGDASKFVIGDTMPLAIEVHPYGAYYSSASSAVKSGISEDSTTIIGRLKTDCGLLYDKAFGLMDTVAYGT